MAWVPTCPHYADRLTPFSTRKWGTHLLAVTDDDNGIYILAVSSATVHVSMQWDAEKLLRKEVQVASNANTRPSLLSLALNARHFIDHVEFGAWTSVGDIPVMYHSSRMVHHATLEVSLGPPLQARLTDEAIKGPLVGTTKDQLSRVTLLQAQVDSLKEKYNAENALGGHVVTKTWGIASFNGLVATCISLHPTNSIEFLMSSEGSAVILFEDRKDTGDDHDPDKFPWQLSPKVDEPKTYKTILDCILDGPLLRSLDLSAFDFKIIYAAICAAVLADDAQRQQRLQTAEGLLYLLQFNTKAKLEAELEMVASCRSSQQAPHQERVQLVRKTTEARGQQTARSNPEKFSLLVHCPYCSVDNLQAIGFESMTEAYCPQRHPFSTLSIYIFFELCLANNPYSQMCSYTFANTRARLLKAMHGLWS